MARKKLGALLEAKGLITEFQLVAALSYQRKWKVKLGKALLELGYLEEKVIFTVLAEQLSLEFVDLYSVPVTEEAKRKLSREQGMALMALPFKVDGDILWVAVSEADREKIQQDLERFTGMSVKLFLAMDSQVDELTRTLPEKVSVASVKPVKKAFRKKENGEIEPIEGAEAAEEPQAEVKEINGAAVPASPAPAAAAEEVPVVLEEVKAPAEPEPPKAEAAGLAMEVPDLELKDEPASGEPLVQEPAAPKPAPAGESAEESEEFWNGAKDAKSAEEIKGAEKEPAPAEQPAKGDDDFFPGQMRSFDEPAPEPPPDLKAVEEVKEIGVEEAIPPVELKEEAMEENRDQEPEQPAAPEKAPVEEAPAPVIPRPPAVAAEPSRDLAGVDKEHVLRQIREIENRINALAILVEELREKLQS